MAIQEALRLLEDSEMNSSATKAVLVLYLVLCYNIFASDGYFEVPDDYKWERVRIHSHTNDSIYTITYKYIDHWEGNRMLGYEKIVMVHDNAGNLIIEKSYSFKDGDLGQMILEQITEDGTATNIIQNETPCNIVVIEPSGDSIFFILSRDKSSSTIRHGGDYSYAMLSEYPKYKDKFNKYDIILFNRYIACKLYHEKLEAEAKEVQK
jgi:hypothetical protein